MLGGSDKRARTLIYKRLRQVRNSSNCISTAYIICYMSRSCFYHMLQYTSRPSILLTLTAISDTRCIKGQQSLANPWPPDCRPLFPIGRTLDRYKVLWGEAAVVAIDKFEGRQKLTKCYTWISNSIPQCWHSWISLLINTRGSETLVRLRYFFLVPVNRWVNIWSPPSVLFTVLFLPLHRTPFPTSSTLTSLTQCLLHALTVRSFTLSTRCL